MTENTCFQLPIIAALIAEKTRSYKLPLVGITGSIVTYGLLIYCLVSLWDTNNTINFWDEEDANMTLSFITK